MGKPRKSSKHAKRDSEVARSHKLFDVPELLQNVMLFSSQGTCAVLSRVARSWTSPAQDRVWENLTVLRPLLERLGDLKDEPDGTLVYARCPTLTDWARFHAAANRVRSLDYIENDEGLPDALFLFISACKRGTDRPHILPRLRRLTWRPSHEEEIPFKLLQLLSPSLQCLESFILDFGDGPVSSCFSQFVNMAGSLIPSTVRRISISHLTAVALEPSDCVTGINAMLTDKPNLCNFQLPLFNYPITVAPLQHRRLHKIFLSHKIDSPGRAFGFVKVLVASLPKLTSVRLCFTSAPHAQAQDRILTFDTLRPLLGLRALERLEVTYDRPLILRPSHVQEMGAAWPRMKALAIWPDDDVDDAGEERATPIKVLADFAHVFSERLEKLCHVFQIDDDQVPNPQSVRTRFVKLSDLSLGSTGMGSPMEFAAFVGTLCPYTEHFLATEQLNPMEDPWSEEERVHGACEDQWGEWHRMLRVVQDVVKGSLQIPC